MNWLEIILLFLAITATFYQFLKIAQYHVLLGRNSHLNVRFSWYAFLALSIFLQVLFVASMTGIVGIEK